jgi:hypothetical protein
VVSLGQCGAAIISQAAGFSHFFAVPRHVLVHSLKISGIFYDSATSPRFSVTLNHAQLTDSEMENIIV